MFLVGDLGGGVDPAAVLLEPKGLRGDPAARREAPEDLAASLTASAGGVSGKDDIAGRVVAGTLTGGARKAGGYSTDDIPLVSGTLRTHTRPGSNEVGSIVPAVAFGGNRQSGPIQVATALNAHGGPHGRLDFETETFVVTPFDTTQSAHPPAIAFDCKAGGDTSFAVGDKAGALRGVGHGGGHAAISYAAGVRRLMPVECERLQGVPDDFTRIPGAAAQPRNARTGPATSSSATHTRGPSWNGSAGGSRRSAVPKRSPPPTSPSSQPSRAHARDRSPMPDCSATGNMTPGGGRNNLKDRCTTCGSKGKMPARTGETAASSWPPS